MIQNRIFLPPLCLLYKINDLSLDVGGVPPLSPKPEIFSCQKDEDVVSSV